MDTIIDTKEILIRLETRSNLHLNRKVSLKRKPDIRFLIKGVSFLHDGAYQYNLEESKDVDALVSETLNILRSEKDIKKEDLLFREMYSVKGILVFASLMLEKYRLDLINSLTVGMYEKSYELEKKHNICDVEPNFKITPKMKKLLKLLKEYDNLINPFANEKVILKEANQYFGSPKVTIEFGINNTYKAYYLYLRNKNVKTFFKDDTFEKVYSSFVDIQIDRKPVKIGIKHVYRRNVGEYICFTKNADSTMSFEDIGDFNLDLCNGTYMMCSKGIINAPITEKNIEMAIDYLNKAIKKIKKHILVNMIAE